MAPNAERFSEAKRFPKPPEEIPLSTEKTKGELRLPRLFSEKELLVKYDRDEGRIPVWIPWSVPDTRKLKARA
jgi:hypothetical protein